MKGSTNQADFKRQLQTMRRQAPWAGMLALNDVARQAQTDVQIQMRQRFDRPTPFVLRSVSVQLATRDKLEASVFIRYPGGKGVDPNRVLKAEFEGGLRSDKRMERALQRIGVLNRGWQVVPASGMPADKLDQWGNVKGSFIVQLISYFQAFGEQGYRSNMTAQRKRRLAKRGRTEGGSLEIRGVEYFISRGKGNWFGRGSWRRGMDQHLPAGIWMRQGIHGSDIKPIFMFTVRPRYRLAIDFAATVLDTGRRELQALYDWRLQDAMATARWT